MATRTHKRLYVCELETIQQGIFKKTPNKIYTTLRPIYLYSILERRNPIESFKLDLKQSSS